MVSLADRRQYQRNPINWPVSVYHPRLGRFINGRSVDVSKGGARVTLPLAANIRPGQIVELNFPRTTTLAKVAGCFSRIKTATVVRVEAGPSAEEFDHALAAQAVAAMGCGFEPKYPEFSAGPTVIDLPPKARRPRRQMVAVRFDKTALSMVG